MRDDSEHVISAILGLSLTTLVEGDSDNRMSCFRKAHESALKLGDAPN
jgi:hypothetical protein